MKTQAKLERRLEAIEEQARPAEPPEPIVLRVVYHTPEGPLPATRFTETFTVHPRTGQVTVVQWPEDEEPAEDEARAEARA